jgi:carbon-monoxide dehydrogenase medium subunit
VQTPAPFEYERAQSVAGAVASLQRLGGDARVIAGGHSLLPMMKLRLAQPEHLIDINDLTELDYIREEGDEVRIGALTRHAELMRSPLLARRFPIFADAEAVIADPVVRNRGTIGGSLCQADAAEDLSAVCTALDAKLVILGGQGERVVGIDDFHVGPYMTAVGDGELLTEVRIPIRPGAGSAHEKVERRAGDWAIAAASAAVWVAGGTITEARVALSAVGLTTIHLGRASELMTGAAPSEDLFRQAAQIASEDCSPSTDGRGPVDYKRHLAGVLTARALARATARALKTEPEKPMQVTISINGRPVSRDIEPRLLLVHFIRDTPGLTGTHWGCDTSNCGACVVLMDGEPVKSCTTLAVMAEGHEIRTVESLEHDGRLDPIQQGFHELHALHCGFCTPGMLMTGRALLDANPDPSEPEIRTAISGAICRCTGYKNIVAAIRWAAEHEAAQRQEV